MKSLNLTLSDSLSLRLTDYVKRHKKTKSHVIRKALHEYLNRELDIEKVIGTKA